MAGTPFRRELISKALKLKRDDFQAKVDERYLPFKEKYYAPIRLFWGLITIPGPDKPEEGVFDHDAYYAWKQSLSTWSRGWLIQERASIAQINDALQVSINRNEDVVLTEPEYRYLRDYIDQVEFMASEKTG